MPYDQVEKLALRPWSGPLPTANERSDNGARRGAPNPMFRRPAPARRRFRLPSAHGTFVPLARRGVAPSRLPPRRKGEEERARAERGVHQVRRDVRGLARKARNLCHEGTVRHGRLLRMPVAALSPASLRRKVPSYGENGEPGPRSACRSSAARDQRPARSELGRERIVTAVSMSSSERPTAGSVRTQWPSNPAEGASSSRTTKAASGRALAANQVRISTPRGSPDILGVTPTISPERPRPSSRETSSGTE